ncbi:MAG: hypothetical protein F4X82_01750 [Candidatus Spechtbacteria bacterium SB0662_bin_43]|uniref:Uncharacterized protein n=1 Tax=Candidatus Spechtbacteria bacterium SB0662_bin_43 TaxID=2604897 RepID=A0A845DJ57_9BACT|nr:hypothetical protein [Candidatus Spechtbacteria bacterium SB0662_bin_43]
MNTVEDKDRNFDKHIVSVFFNTAAAAEQFAKDTRENLPEDSCGILHYGKTTLSASELCAKKCEENYGEDSPD